MFEKLKVNNFYNKLLRNQKISKEDFDIFDVHLKEKIIEDERFATTIDLSLIILKDNISDKYFIEKFYIENLKEKDLIIIINRLSNYYLSDSIDLSNIYEFLKEKYIFTNNDKLKESISQLLFATVKNTYHQDYNYIKSFINLFKEEGLLKLLENKTMIKFITYTLKGNDYYGYANYFETILENVTSETIKYKIMNITFDFMPKNPNIKSLYLKNLTEKLNLDSVIKLLSNANFKDCFQYKDSNTYFCFDELLNIVNKISNFEIKKSIIRDYFVNYPYISNVIDDWNKDLDKNNVISGETMLAFNELRLISKDISDLIITSCNDDILFDYLSKLENKEERLLEIKVDVSIDKLLAFADKYNINIYDVKFAQKFEKIDEYYKSLPKENAGLIKYYYGNNIELFFEKLSLCDNKKNILKDSQFKFNNQNFDKLLQYTNSNGIDIYNEMFAKKFSNFDEFYKGLTKENVSLLINYNGNNIDLFLDKLLLSDNKLNLLFSLDENKSIKVMNSSLERDYFNEFERNAIEEVVKTKDEKLRNILKEFILENYNNITPEKFEYIREILLHLSTTNSLEMFNFKTEIAKELLNVEKPIESLEKLEQIFLKNNLPIVGKVYYTFEVLHPELSGYDFSNSSKISPILKRKSTMGKKVTIFSDLLKTALGSNNRSLKEYIDNLEMGNKLYKIIVFNHIKYEDLDANKKQILNTYINHLFTLYNNSTKGKNNPIIKTNNINQDIIQISRIFPNANELSDNIVKMFCHFAGFDTLEELKTYMEYALTVKEKRNIELLKNPIELKEGDLIKGIRDISYLKNILQNGSVAKDFLGAYSGSDLTPLDTDLSKINEKKDSIEETINCTLAKNYGSIYIVLKNDDRFVTTRDSNFLESVDKFRSTKYELFCTGNNGHYGIRTGFASSDIDYIITLNDDPRIGLEIAMNGFYIPVIDMQGKVIFTKKDYDNLKNQMSGLTYYGVNDYKFSENLVNDEVLKITLSLFENNVTQRNIKSKIYETFEKVFNTFDLKLKDGIDGDLVNGTVEIIDTGSTGRFTNLIDNADYDFILRFDKNILLEDNKFKKIKKALIDSFGKIENQIITSDGNFRFKGVKINGLDKTVDLDITFTQKTNKINYSTDAAIKDRLNLIHTIDSKKYDLVLANIILAKQVLKEAEVYKPNRGLKPEGGLGGVGVENWILMHGGSFVDASKHFLEVANGKSFEEFKDVYKIWDFGENYLSQEKNIFTHDEFISNNMTEEGFIKMQEVLAQYLEKEEILITKNSRN